jgi:membrane protease YdiL (CAAX protease family)
MAHAVGVLLDVPLDSGSSRPLAGYAVATAVVCWLAIVVPLLGMARYRALAAGPVELVPFYRRVLARQWALVVAVVAALAALGVPPSGIGLRWRVEAAPPLAAVVLPGVAAVGIATVVLRAQARLRPAAALAPRLLRPVAALLPTTARERRYFAAVAVSAGVGEEVLYRGVVVWWLASTAPALGTTGIAVASAGMFGLAHAYQGPLGVAATSAAGYVLASMYVVTGSLVAPMVLHAVVDLRVLLLVPATAVAAPALTSTFPPPDGRSGEAR